MHPENSVTRAPRGTHRRKLLMAGFAVAALAISLAGCNKAPDAASADPARTAALASTHSPSHGEPTAKVQIVEFLDPACETCAIFYQLVQEVMEQNPGKIRLMTRHVAFHEGSEYPVRVLEASRKQGKYWETLEILFANQAQWAPNHTVQPELVLQTVSSLGMNLEQLMTDMNSPEVAEHMAKDLQDAGTLQVTATPEYFVNGRPLPEFGDQQLMQLIREELDKAH